jgi:hypothetical protein
MLSLFYIEAVGFGRGLGVLDINKDAISKCYMLNPNLLTDKQKSDILEKFVPLINRGIIDINQDLDDPVRQEFEKTVLSAFDISDYYDNIVNSLKAMRRIRKAVKQENAQIRQLDDSGRYDAFDEQPMLMAADSRTEN